MASAKMTVKEEYAKEKADSPALTEATSYTSSPEPSPHDESKHDSIRRNLFMDIDPPKDTIDTPSTGLAVREGDLTPRRSGNGLAGTTSTTSSQTTAIPSWNLSTTDATEKDVEVPLENFILSQPIPVGKTRPLLSSPSSFGSDETQLSGENQPQLLGNETTSSHPAKQDDKERIEIERKEKIKHSVVMEDPPEAPTSCNAVLNVAEIVLAFGQSARQRYQGAEQTDEAVESASLAQISDSMKEDTSIGSPPPIVASRHLSESSSQSESQSSVIRSIEQERDTLKTNTKRDAYTISKLQLAIETQKQLNSLKENEIMDKQAELQVLTKHIRTLQKEQDDYLERETELRETIDILKKELDKMTLLNSAPSDELDQLNFNSELTTHQADIDHFKKEAKLAESRANEQQVRIEELEMSLQEKERENFDLQTKIDWLNDQRKEKNQDERTVSITSTYDDNLDKAEIYESDEIESRLQEIMKRLEAVEIEKRGIEVDNAKSSDENREGEIIIPKQNESEHNGVKINVLEDPDEIETLKLKKKTMKEENPGSESAWCCNWS